MSNYKIIFSKQHDIATDDVIDWLLFFGENKILRLNGEDFVKKECFKVELNKNNIKFFYSNEINIDSIWLRKGAPTSVYNYSFIEPEQLRNQIKQHLLKEAEECKLNVILSCIHDKIKVVGNIPFLKHNKFMQLIIAKDVGFNIPDTVMTNSKAYVEHFLRERETLVAKNIKDSTFIYSGSSTYSQYTEPFDASFVEKVAIEFNPSLIQEQLLPEYEVRVFFLDNKCYSMAIINKSKNKIDYRRNYAKNGNNNRFVKYQLPKKTENAICKFMNKMELNTGSIDLVKTKEGKYFFLEVNPSGQIGMLSYPCNYYLEKKIAENLL